MVSVLNISSFGESSICTRMQFVGTSSETVLVFKFNLKTYEDTDIMHTNIIVIVLFEEYLVSGI